MIELRPARPADVPAVHGVITRAYQAYQRSIGFRPPPMDRDVGALLDRETVLVATADGTVVGALELALEADHALVPNVAVDPDQQGRGIGGRLLDEAERLTRAAGLSELRLFTHEAMTANLAWYARRGFVEDHRADVRVFLTKRL